MPTPQEKPASRPQLRAHLLAACAAWLTTPAALAATAALGPHLCDLLKQLEPQVLGLYWPLDGEFNAAGLLLDVSWAHLAIEPPLFALPFAQREPCQMDYRRWDGSPPTVKDECGIPSSANAAIVIPDVVLVPCVGYTREGYRLGYGGGYFDRWLADHPGVTSIGIAWAVSEVEFEVAPHDQAMTLIVTEAGVVGG